MLNTSENDQTRLLWSSHDWHVQPDCQRSTPDTAKAGRFGSRLNTARSGASSNLLRCVTASVHRTSCIAQAALGELFETIGNPSQCQQKLLIPCGFPRQPQSVFLTEEGAPSLSTALPSQEPA